MQTTDGHILLLVCVCVCICVSVNIPEKEYCIFPLFPFACGLRGWLDEQLLCRVDEDAKNGPYLHPRSS